MADDGDRDNLWNSGYEHSAYSAQEELDLTAYIILNCKGVWGWHVTITTTGFLDFVHHLVFWKQHIIEVTSL
jgi:hypothetical protein